MGGPEIRPATPLEPDPESLRTLRVTETPHPHEVGGVGLVRELSQMFVAAPDVPPSRDRALLLPTPPPVWSSGP